MKKVVFVIFTVLFIVSCNSQESIVVADNHTRKKIAILDKEVRVYYDEYMVPHIYGENDSDVYKMLGYIEAQDRLFEMELFRRLSTGRLAELLGDFGGLVIQLDWIMRALFTTPRGTRVYDEMAENMDGESKKAVQDFVEGINYYFKELRDGKDLYFPEEFKHLKITKEQLSDWTIRDVCAIDRLLTLNLSTTLDEEFQFSSWYEGLKNKDPQLLSELLNLRPVAMTPTMPIFSWWSTSSTTPDFQNATASTFTADIDTGKVNIDSLNNLHSFFEELDKTFFYSLKRWASNDFVVSGEKSKTGNAFLANDPHLELITPPMLYEFQLDSKSLPGATGSLKVEGLSFMGVPAVVIGHNEHVAWGGTFLGYDVTDIYSETISDGTDGKYALYKGNWEKISQYEDVIKVRKYPETGFYYEKVVYPYIKRHGPVISLNNVSMTGSAILLMPDKLSGIDTVSIKWTGMEPSKEIKAYFDINRAKTYQEFVSAASLIGVGGQNLVFADDKGNIGYFPAARVPVREAGSKPWIIMDGTGGHEWTGYIPFEELPQVTTKEDIDKYNSIGFIATANNEQFGQSYDNNPLNEKYYLTSDGDIGFREERISNLFESGISSNSVDLEYIEKVQTDTYSLVGEYFMKLLNKKILNKPEAIEKIEEFGLEEALTYLKNWSYFTPTGTGDPFGMKVVAEEVNDSVATSLFHGWIKRIVKNTFYDELDYYNVPHPSNEWGIKMLYYLLSATSTTDSPTYDAGLGYSRLFNDINTVEDETDVDIVIKSLVETLEFWKDKVGSDNLRDYRWGIVHQALFIDPYLTKTRGPYPKDGGDFTVNVGKTNSSGTDFTNTHSAVTRFIVELGGDKIKAVNVMPGYNQDQSFKDERWDQMPLWLHDEYREMHFYLDDVKIYSLERFIYTK